VIRDDRDFAIWALGCLTAVAILILTLPVPDKVWLIVLAVLTSLLAGAFYSILGHTCRELVKFVADAIDAQTARHDIDRAAAEDQRLIPTPDGVIVRKGDNS